MEQEITLLYDFSLKKKKFANSRAFLAMNFYCGKKWVLSNLTSRKARHVFAAEKPGKIGQSKENSAGFRT